MIINNEMRFGEIFAYKLKYVHIKRCAFNRACILHACMYNEYYDPAHSSRCVVFGFYRLVVVFVVVYTHTLPPPPTVSVATREDFKLVLREVRRNNNNTLSGLSLDSIADQVRSIIESREKTEGEGSSKVKPRPQLPPVAQAPPPVNTATEYTDEWSCVICYEDMDATDSSRLMCGHRFYTEVYIDVYTCMHVLYTYINIMWCALFRINPSVKFRREKHAHIMGGQIIHSPSPPSLSSPPLFSPSLLPLSLPLSSPSLLPLWFKEQNTCPTCRNYALLPDEYPFLSH